MKKAILILCLLVSVSMVLFACGKEEPEKTVEFISQDVSIYPGDTFQLEYVVPEGRSVEFSSTDTSVFTIDQNGLVTGVNSGKAIVIASTGEREESYLAITVLKGYMSASVNAELKAQELNLLVGMNYDLALSVQKAGESVEYSVNWKSANENVATVADGEVIAVSEGQTVITATVTSGEETVTRQCSVTVYPHYRIEVAEVSVEGIVGDVFMLNAAIYDAAGNVVTPADGELELVTSDPRIVKEQDGSFKIVGVGHTGVGVRYKGNLTSIPLTSRGVTADFFASNSADFKGEVGDHAFVGVQLTSTKYKPSFNFSSDGIKQMSVYATEYGYTKIRIHAYSKDNALTINDTVCDANVWSTYDFDIANINDSFIFKSQSTTITEAYFWFEFL